MKAYVLHEINKIRKENVPMPVPKPDETVVRVRAVGICGSDIPRIYETGAHVMPMIPGHELSGEVLETGEHVGVFPLIPCGECVPCRKKHYEMCRHYDYIGSRRDGGFAEYVAVPRRNLLPIPRNVSFAQAAMLEPMAVAVHAIRRILPLPIFEWDQEESGNSSGKSILIVGVGTIGMLLLSVLLDAGYERVFVIGNKDLQKKKAMECGRPEEHFCDSRTTDPEAFVMERTDGLGADAVFECVGREQTVRMTIDLTAPGGSLCLVGNPASDMTLPRDTYWKILRHQILMTGTWNSSFSFLVSEQDDWQYAVSRIAAGTLQPEMLISHTFGFDDLPKGLAIMRDKTEEYLKVMIEI